MHLHRLIGVLALSIASASANAQLARTRDPAGAGMAAGGAPRDPQHPYAGMWAGIRTMPLGSDEIRLRFNFNNDAYDGAMLYPDGHRAPANNPTLTGDGLTWESPNSGGGMWVYRIHLASPDSMVGSLVLRDAPPNLRPAPEGTLVLKRQPPEKRKQP